MIDACPICGTTDLSWVDRRFGHCERNGGAGFRNRIDAVAGYHPGLARFPNDPKAHVDGPASLQKRLDELAREGKHRVDYADLAPTGKRPTNVNLAAQGPLRERVKRAALKRLNEGA